MVAEILDGSLFAPDGTSERDIVDLDAGDVTEADASEGLALDLSGHPTS